MATVGMDIGHSESTWELKGSKGIRTSLHPSGRFEEHWFNAEVSLIAKAILERHGVKVVMAQKPNDNVEVSLRARTDFYDAHNCDLIVSNHANAGVKTADGFCVFYWHNSADAKRFAQIILRHSKSLPIDQFGTGIIASVPNTWTDFHMCREPKAISPLIEWGFFTNENDLKLILSPEFRKQCGEVEAKAILEYFEIEYKPEVKEVSQPKVEQTKETVKPNQKPKSHTIAKGDTFYSIAKKFGFTVKQIQEFNPRVNADNLQIGDVIHFVPFLDQPKVESKPVEKKPEPVKPAPKPEQKSQPKKPKYYLPNKVLSKGMKGSDVLALQKALCAAYFYPDKGAKNDGCDGIFGKMTESALKRFQSVHANPVDGVYGSKSREALDRIVNK